VGLTDLLVAAVAEQHQITVLHYDSDYDTIGELTDLQAVWVIGPGDVA
jgi:predicted nucleic acid-binding protein